MTPETKQVWKAIALSAGILLVVTSIGIMVYRYFNKDDEPETNIKVLDQTPDNPTPSYTSSTSKGYNNLNYSFADVERMQAWLVKIATLWQNNVILKAIRDSGGIDGKMGTGFNIALKEAIRVTYVKDLNDLYTKSKS